MPGRASSSSHPQGFTIPYGFEIPEGFCITTVGPNNQPVLVPSYMKAAAQAMFDLERAKESVGSAKASSSPMPSPYQHAAIGEMNIEIPPDLNPPPSDRELLDVHAEVESIQQRFGMSYEAACRLLYHQQLERAKRADEEAKAWEDMERSISESMHAMNGFYELLESSHEHDNDPTLDTEDVVEDIAEQPKKDRKGKGKARDIGN